MKFKATFSKDGIAPLTVSADMDSLEDFARFAIQEARKSLSGSMFDYSVKYDSDISN